MLFSSKLIRSQLFFKSIATINKMVPSLKLSDYDVIGLDLDNTLLEYNLTNLFNLQYKFLSHYLTNMKGYDKTIFPEELSEHQVDFIQRGLFLDLKRGNLLHLRNDGYILKATHGSRKMDDLLVEDIYGKERKWSVTNKLKKNLLSLWDNSDTRSFLDFTDSIASLMFAKAVDAVDLLGRPSEYNVWPDLLEAIVQMYEKDSSYIQTIALNLHDFMKPCDKNVLMWLANLRKHSKLILITGAEIEMAEVTLPLCLGKDYNEFFDLIIYNAKKPGFFNKSRPFLTIDNNTTNDIILGNQYKQGNWSDLHKTLAALLQKNPKCLYIGDNPLQDIFTPTTVSEKMDVIALIEEVAAEGLYPDFPEHPDSKYISSKFWESFLYSEETTTFFGEIIKTRAKIVIPSLKVLAEKSIDYVHSSIMWEKRDSTLSRSSTLSK